MSVSSLGRIRVVTAVIERQGCVLTTQRRFAGILAGLREPPGGKVDVCESDAQTLRRVLRERVGIDVLVRQMKAHRTHHHVGWVAKKGALKPYDRREERLES